MLLRAYGRLSTFPMSVALCIMLPCSGSTARAQDSRAFGDGSNIRRVDGWTAFTPNAERVAASGQVGAQHVYYQTQNGLSDLPRLPSFGGGSPGSGYNLPTLPSNVSSPSSLPVGQAGLPVLPTAPAPQNGQQGYNPTVAPELPRGIPPANLLPVGRPAEAATRQTAAPPAVRSGGAEPQSGMDYRSSPQNIPSQPVAYGRETAPPQDAGNPMRAIHDSRQAAPSTGSSGIRIPSQAIATGPPFVTPAPRRVGNFSTSPYNPALFQFAAYQRGEPVNAPPQSAGGQPYASGQLVAATGAAPGLTAAQPVQPQFQNPGIYPTAAYQCAPNPSFPSAGVGPGTYAPPTLTPNLTPGLYSSNNSGYSPVFSLGQENYNVLLGRGIVGQPTVYVPGQPMRNFLRYLSP